MDWVKLNWWWFESYLIRAMYFQSNTLHQPLNVIEQYYETGMTEPPHSHVCHQLIIVKHGFIRVATPKGFFAITQHRGIWLTQNTEHSLSILKNTQVLSAFVEPLARADLPNRSQVVVISELLQALLSNASGIDSHYADNTREAWIVELILDELRRLTPLADFEVPQPTLSEYSLIYKKISQRLSHQWALADIAQMLGISERTVSRQFTAQTGLSFVEWLRRLRLQHSLELLLQGQSVVDVALAVGYDSPSAFSTAFKQRIGVSPTQYVVQYQQNFNSP